MDVKLLDTDTRESLLKQKENAEMAFNSVAVQYHTVWLQCMQADQADLATLVSRGINENTKKPSLLLGENSFQESVSRAMPAIYSRGRKQLGSLSRLVVSSVHPESFPVRRAIGQVGESHRTASESGTTKATTTGIGEGLF